MSRTKGAWLPGLLLLACHPGVAGRGMPNHYAQGFDSATSACRTRPFLCARVAGEETVVPSTAPRMAEAGVAVATIASALRIPDRMGIERALAECADLARSQVLVRELDGRSPTPGECREKGSFGGRFRTRAMFLGEEMHRVALACAASKLGALRPGGFSVEPRYRYDSRTRQLELVSPDTEEMLLEQGCHGELRGTLKPDIVIHSGHPLAPQAVYDFKFPCVDPEFPLWCRYRQGPHQGLTQDELYRKALSVNPAQVAPRIGVVP